MAERNDRNERAPDRRAAEGVRIIGAEEAQKALDAGQAAGRRADDELRYGDVPPAPTGPRPPHRFPLPGSVDPAAAVPRPPVAPIKGDPTLGRAGRQAGSTQADATAKPDGAPTTDPADPTGAAEHQTDPDGRDVGAAEARDGGVTDAGARDEAGSDADPTGGLWSAASSEDGADTAMSGPDPVASATAPVPTVGVGERAEAGGAPSGRSDPSESGDGSGDVGYRPSYPPPSYDPPREPPSPWAPIRGSKSSTWPAAVEGLAAGAGQSVGADAERVRGSEPSDPYAWRGMADQPQDEPPTTASLWAPAAEGPGRGWNLGERPEDRHDPYPDDPAVPDLAPPEAGINLTGSHVLPHWSEPASGEVPAALADPARGAEDYEGWDAAGANQARWRSEHDDWDDASDVHYLAGDEEPGGALDSDLGDRSDLYSFDEDFERLEEERSGTHQAVPFDGGAEASEPPPVAIGTRTARRRTPSTGVGPTGRRMGAPNRRASGGDLTNRVIIGVGMLIVLAVAYLLGPRALVVLAAAVVVACAVETYGILQRSGFRPATLLGLVATGGLVFAGYWRGIGALPLVLALTVAATMVWYLLGIVEARPLANVAVTSMAVLWIGFFGSFSALLLRAGDGKQLFIGVVAVVVVSDIAAYLVGGRLGRHALAPDISPGKTVEGLIAGAVAAIVAGIVVGREVTVYGGVKHGIALGVMVAILGPIKRDLNVKDSGTALGGHGGLLDRFDSLLIVLPGAYFLASYLNILK
jgi:phosphatidate cytidylyltransferase